MAIVLVRLVLLEVAAGKLVQSEVAAVLTARGEGIAVQQVLPAAPVVAVALLVIGTGDVLSSHSSFLGSAGIEIQVVRGSETDLLTPKPP